MKKILYVLAISGAIAAQGCGNNSGSKTQTSDTTAMATDSTAADTASVAAAPADTTFANKAAVGGMAEVEFGKIALKKATNAKLKDFAAMMVKDHGMANEELKGIATAKKIVLPTTLDAEHAKVQAELEAKSGADFDKAYAKAMVDGHVKTLTLMENGSQNNQDKDLKSFATKTAPIVKHHLDVITKIQTELK